MGENNVAAATLGVTPGVAGKCIVFGGFGAVATTSAALVMLVLTPGDMGRAEQQLCTDYSQHPAGRTKLTVQSMFFNTSYVTFLFSYFFFVSHAFELSLLILLFSLF